MARHKKELEASDIQELLERTPAWLLEQEARTSTREIPLGLTWTVAVENDNSRDSYQQALDVANARAVKGIIESLPAEVVGNDYEIYDSFIVYRLLGTDGDPTPLATEIGPILLGLSDYPSISDDVLSEVERERFDDAWEDYVLREVRNGGTFHVWRRGQGHRIEIDEDKLFDGWEEKLYDAYRDLDTGGARDDQGYDAPDQDTVLRALVKIGILDANEIQRRDQ